MSASTVSVTANSRRRPSAVSDMKQSIDIVNATTISPNLDKSIVGNGENDKVMSENKDLSHSSRGEAVLERSKDKKSSQLLNSNGPIRTRNRKAATGLTKSPKPRWMTLLSILIKNLLLLIVLGGLVQMVRKLVINSGNLGDPGNLAEFSEMERRIAEVEYSLKKTTNMLQVQVEVVDTKFESEVGNLRREMNRRIEDKSGEFNAQLEKLNERIGDLELRLDELKLKGFLTKDDVMNMYGELKSSKNGGSVGLNYDDIRNLARDVVEKEIKKHAADGLGRVDYALASAGSKVVDHSEPLDGWKMAGLFSGNSKNRVHSKANKMLMPSFGQPGECFPLKGSSGFVKIRLRSAIVPEAITLEHVAESVAYDRSSAPKHCQVYGYLQGKQGLETSPVELEKKFLLTDFTYDLDKSNAQTFNVLEEVRSSIIDTVIFEFKSNHGSPVFTCIYRVRVHGHEPKSVPVVPIES
ncbi:SUN domain-containing protein 1 [Amaranthus tricolor]|uniref:SUN domain-containing protein 1 n=1 Tax=Amaranthus tricolor TaxID=29722 RepID=UPI00258BD5E5|nr:SUN domain-containing protein 1 [Amaranthus tricolor]